MALTQVSTGGIKDGQVQTADLADGQVTVSKLHADALDRTYTLGADGSNHYTFTGEGLTGAVNDPTLYLTRGKTYRFVNGNSAGAHPFRIQTTVNGSAGTEYNTGVTNNGGAGGSTIIFEVPHDAPDVLYYQCTSHGSMGGIFYITGALADGGVTTAKLAADAVTGAKLADDAVDSEHFVDGSIDTAHIADDAVTDAKLANAINTAIAANTAKTTNATHTGEVTGATALTIADDVVDEANLKVSNTPTNGYFLSAQSGNTGGLTWAEAGGGKLLQIVQTHDYGNQLYSTSTSYVNTGLNLDITTGSDASKLLIIANPQIGARGSSGQNAYANVALAKDGTIVRHGFSGAWMGNTSSISNYNVYETCTLIYLDSSVSTSTTYNYRIKIKRADSTTTQAQYNPHIYEGNGGSWITILEIAA